MSNGTDSSEASITDADVLAIDDAIQQSTGAQSYGLVATGFVPKPFARLLAEKLSLARALFGDDLDLSSGAAIRKILEVSALEDARTWAALAGIYDNMFVSSAAGDGLSRLGDELSVARPNLEANGTIHLKLVGKLPAPTEKMDQSTLELAMGSRLLTTGGHHAYLSQTVVLSAADAERDVPVTAFYPGPEHNLDPSVAAADGSFPQKLTLWNPSDVKLETLRSLAQTQSLTPEQFVTIAHTQKLTGGELYWPDERYRDLLLSAPRSLWTVEAVRTAVSLVPGVRQVMVRDWYGGLDINQSVFGYFSFLERVFSGERDVASPYFFTVLVAPTEAAIWDGTDGLAASVAMAIEDLRPIGIYPEVKEADQVWVGISADIVVSGLPLPRSKGAIIDDADVVVALKQRLLGRVGRYVESLQFGEPVRASEVIWAIMNEPGIADVQNLRLLRFPPSYLQVVRSQPPNLRDYQQYDYGQNVTLQATQIATFVDDYSFLHLV